VLWIVILLGLVVVLSMKGMVLVEKREQADRLGRELDAITEAVAELAAEKSLEPGTEVEFVDYAPYFNPKAAKRMRVEGEDPVGGRYGTQVVGEEAVADPKSIEALGEFWK